MTMELTAAFEEIALGEAQLAEARRTVARALAELDEPVAARLYEALRSWVWKTLEARRRDDELIGWLDVLGRVSSHLDERHRSLSVKLEACVELLHISVARASSPAASPFSRKHVRRVMKELHRGGGSLRKRELQAATELKEANLSRVLSPLRDEGWVVREMEGKEAIYRLTEAGRHATPPHVLVEAESVYLRDAGIDVLYQQMANGIMFADAGVTLFQCKSVGRSRKAVREGYVVPDDGCFDYFGRLAGQKPITPLSPSSEYFEMKNEFGRVGSEKPAYRMTGAEPSFLESMR